MAELEQFGRVARRKVINRVSELNVCTVEGYEAKAAPTADAHCSIVLGRWTSALAENTLAHMAVWQEFVLRFYYRLPLGDEAGEEQVDPRLVEITHTVAQALVNPVNYGDGVEIDPLGHAGERMNAQPGYLDQDGVKFRTVDLSAGFIIYNALDLGRT